MAQIALSGTDDRTEALRDTHDRAAGHGRAAQALSPAMMSGLDIHYDLGEGHPLLGRRMPDLDLVTADGPLRVFALLHDARPVLLNLGRARRLRHRAVGGSGPSGRGTLRRRVGAPGARRGRRPAAVLIRPDGHVAWVGEGTDAGLAGRADHLVRGTGRGVARAQLSQGASGRSRRRGRPPRPCPLDRGWRGTVRA